MKKNDLKINSKHLVMDGLVFIVGTSLALSSCIYFCIEINTAAYRLVAIFISLIFISNLGARLLFNYFERKT